MKVAFICASNQEDFIKDVAKYISQFHEVKEVYGYNGDKIRDAVAWADVVWQEWVDQIAIGLSHQPIIAKKKLIMRLHSYEALVGYIPKVNWSVVDHLIFVADNVKNISLPQIGQVNQTNNFLIWTIPNGVDLEKYKLTEDEQRYAINGWIDGKRVDQTNQNLKLRTKAKGKNLAYIGTITNKKGPMLMLQAFEKLICEDEGFRLHVAGNIADMRYEVYLNHIINEMGLNDFITFYGHQNNMAEWLRNMHYVCCSSPWESQNMSVMEAMATGCCPLVHNFPGAKQIYPEEFVWTTVNEFADLALSLPWEPEKYRQVIKDRYNLEDTNKQIKEIFDEIEGEMRYGTEFKIRN